MAKYAGLVGYGAQVETSPGIWEFEEKDIFMTGDVIRQVASIRYESKVSPDISISHRISLVADKYALDNYYNIKWAEMDGQKWTVTGVEVQRPRIIVSLGGLWNGN